MILVRIQEVFEQVPEKVFLLFPLPLLTGLMPQYFILSRPHYGGLSSDDIGLSHCE